MNDRQTVRVALAERSYDIHIGRGLLAETAALAGQALERLTHVVLVTDTNVRRPHAEAVAAALTDAGVRTDLLVVPAGEASKSIVQATALWEGMLAAGADRRTVVAAVGGGVVGDLAGFVAATFARGVPFLQVPTTLLAHVDSSVGGKVGVNLPQAKNMVGAFWQPSLVVIDTTTLHTLPDREYRAGLAEVIKYGVILDADFFAYLERHAAPLHQRRSDVLGEVIARSCRLKADIVAADEREETGLRAVLNYGHTFAHAFEAVAGYGELLHGEAVAIGMLCASRLAERLGRIGPDVTRRQADLLAALGLPLAAPALGADELLAAMQRDKKVEHGRLRFVLPTRLGHVELVADVPPDDVRAALAG